MGFIKLLAAPIRSVIRFPLFQLAVVVAIILWFQAAAETSVQGRLFTALDGLVDATVSLFAAMFTVKSFTRSWLTAGFMIAYVWTSPVRSDLRRSRDCSPRIRRDRDRWAHHRVSWLRNTIARERGIEAYRAWLPLERIRPDDISQETWEERFWPGRRGQSSPAEPGQWPAATAPAFLATAPTWSSSSLRRDLDAHAVFPVVDWLVALARRFLG